MLVKEKNNGLKMSDIGQKWSYVIRAFLKDYSAKLSASDISKKINVERKSISRTLNNLVKLNLIKYKIHGRNKLFYFDLENPKTKILFEIAENQKSMDFCLNQKNVFLVIKDLLDICSSIVVFGSFASGEQNKDSDLDLVVFECKNKKKLKEIKDTYLLEINEYDFNYAEFEKMLDKKVSLALEIKENHVIFGNVSVIVEMFLK